MRETNPIARTMRPVPDVRVTQDFEVEPLGPVWDPKRVPIVINSFNRLTYLRRLVDALRSRGYDNLYVIDNASTYEPLLEYYRHEGLRVFYLDANVGFLAMWATPVGANFVDDFYVYTDPDVEPVSECPDDFMEVFRRALDRHPRIDKVGFGLKIDDLPDHYALKDRVVEHERRIMSARRGRGLFYRAAIDTTFALYRPGAAGGSALRALRTAEPYVARHLPWYEDSARPTEEEKFYLSTIATSTGWSFRGDADAKVLEVPLGGQTVRVVAGANDLAWNEASRGEWKPEVYQAIDRLADAQHSYLEIGTGPGQTALYAGRVARKVYALDPDPDTYPELEENVALNAQRLGDVTALRLAVRGVRNEGDVPSFSEFSRTHDVSDCSLVSVDMDGQEHRVFPDLLPFLKRTRPTLCVSLWPGRRYGITTARATGKAAIGALGLIETAAMAWRLRFYEHVYIGQGEELTLRGLVRNLGSRISIVATDRTWPAS